MSLKYKCNSLPKQPMKPLELSSSSIDIINEMSDSLSFNNISPPRNFLESKAIQILTQNEEYLNKKTRFKVKDRTKDLTFDKNCRTLLTCKIT